MGLSSHIHKEKQGQFWLNNVDGGVYYNQKYLAHLLLPGEEIAVLISFKLIILFDINSLLSKWVIKFEQIKSISVEPTGLTIQLKAKRVHSYLFQIELAEISYIRKLVLLFKNLTSIVK